MGLDITAYRQVKKEDVVLNENGEPIDPSTKDYRYDLARVRANSDFPSRAEGIEDGHYSYEASHGFCAGSYSGYNWWRNELAKFAGYPATAYIKYGSETMRHDAGAWAATSGPFYELINFSDCEGVIGPVVAKKLAQDFADFADRAMAYQPDIRGDWYARYLEWQTAFLMAADNGFVDFH